MAQTRILILLALLALPAIAHSQTAAPIPANNATAVTVFWKHDAVNTTSYKLCAQPVQGNPICSDVPIAAPDANGERSAKLQALAPGVYQLAVLAVGPGGTGSGSLPGGVQAIGAPGAPTGIRIVATITIVVGG